MAGRDTIYSGLAQAQSQPYGAGGPNVAVPGGPVDERLTFERRDPDIFQPPGWTPPMFNPHVQLDPSQVEVVGTSNMPDYEKQRREFWERRNREMIDNQSWIDWIVNGPPTTFPTGGR